MERKQGWIALFFWGCAAALAAQVVAAEGAACGPRAQIVEQLEDRYGERRRAAGLTADGLLMELFAAEGTGSWTITLTQPGGPTCLVGAGQAFHALSAQVAEDGQGA
ncbi:hypothetical protein AADZ90_005340 [Aestuariibius sp. 2305UL40-4]|uniref:hypothetical protein n=1 Tax=Aestuariibius violaceus TaxID=3234132 RepID=UPI00345EA106